MLLIDFIPAIILCGILGGCGLLLARLAPWRGHKLALVPPADGPVRLTVSPPALVPLAQALLRERGIATLLTDGSDRSLAGSGGTVVAGRPPYLLVSRAHAEQAQALLDQWSRSRPSRHR